MEDSIAIKIYDLRKEFLEIEVSNEDETFIYIGHLTRMYSDYITVEYKNETLTIPYDSILSVNVRSEDPMGDYMGSNV